MFHLDLFSGIGGFSLAASHVWENHTIVAFCEIDLFCQKVLKKHWPNVPIFSDIKKLKGSNFETVDLITGGFPCQPFSEAGNGQGRNDKRYLWPEMFRIIKETNSRWILVENVPRLLNTEQGMVFEEICVNLECENYEVWPFSIPACGLNAPHKRQRTWIVAYSNSKRLEIRKGQSKNNGKKFSNFKRNRANWSKEWINVATRLCGMDDGLPKRMDRNQRIKALGNAIVPRIAEQFFQAMKYIDSK